MVKMLGPGAVLYYRGFLVTRADPGSCISGPAMSFDSNTERNQGTHGDVSAIRLPICR